MDAEQSEMDEWLRGILPRAVAYARTLLPRRDPGAAEDIVQDVLCRLLQHDDYDLLSNGGKLLFTSVTNACINATSRGRRLLSLDARHAGGGALGETLAAARPGPAQQAVDKALLAHVEAELMALPVRQRAAVELKAMGHTLREIAAALGVSQQNAGVLVHRGRKSLRAKLGQELPEVLR